MALTEDLRAGFELKISEYRCRLKTLRPYAHDKPAFSGADDGVFLTGSRDDLHSLYKMEIMKRLLRDGTLNFETLEADMHHISHTSSFNPHIFRNAYEVVLDYCKGKHELPRLVGRAG